MTATIEKQLQIIREIEERGAKLGVQKARLIPQGDMLGVVLTVGNLTKEEWREGEDYQKLLSEIALKNHASLRLLSVVHDRPKDAFKEGDRVEIFCEFVAEPSVEKDSLTEAVGTRTTAWGWVPGRVTKAEDGHCTAEMERVTCSSKGEPVNKIRMFDYLAGDVRLVKS